MARKILSIGCFLFLIGCTSKSEEIKQVKLHSDVSTEKINISPIEELKAKLRFADSLIMAGEYREALKILDTFQNTVKDDIFLIQALVLEFQALDSVYAE